MQCSPFIMLCLGSIGMDCVISESCYYTLVNVNAPVVAKKSWWLHFSAPVVA